MVTLPCVGCDLNQWDVKIDKEPNKLCIHFRFFYSLKFFLSYFIHLSTQCYSIKKKVLIFSSFFPTLPLMYNTPLHGGYPIVSRNWYTQMHIHTCTVIFNFYFTKTSIRYNLEFQFFTTNKNFSMWIVGCAINYKKKYQ